MFALDLKRTAGMALTLCVMGVWSDVAAGSEVAGCPAVDAPAAPRTTISNGEISAVVLLPDAEKGYYRGTRFDWSGVVWCLMYKGHNYFGTWNTNGDPASGARITGPVEEFRAADGRSSPGYDAARPGEPFDKPGVGVLQRIDEKPYSFNTAYPVLDRGKWRVQPRRDRVTFRHDLASPTGMRYRYEKTLRLERNAPVLVIEHALRNVGKQPIDIQVYNHDFFVFDGATTGPDISVRFPFTPVLDRTLANGAWLDGNTIRYRQPLEPGKNAQAWVTGFGTTATDFNFHVENAATRAGVQQTGDRPISQLQYWSNPLTACPEAYVRIVVPPGKTERWSIRYRFYTF